MLIIRKEIVNLRRSGGDIRVVRGGERRGKIMQILYSYEVLKFEKKDNLALTEEILYIILFSTCF